MKSRETKRRSFPVETANMAFTAISSNKLRSWLTIAVITIGITSLVGILTAVEAMRTSISDTYSKLGSNSMTITEEYFRSSGNKRSKNPPYITMAQARLFKERYDIPATVSIYASVAYNLRVEAGGKRTNPNIDIIGCDENMLVFKNFNLSKGRPFNTEDINAGRNYCIIGSGVGKSLYPEGDAVGNPVFIKGRRYTVVGEIDEMGNSGGRSIDNQIMIPYTNASASNISQNVLRFTVGILPYPETDEETASSEAVNIFRAVRRLAPYDENDFRIERMEAEIREMNKAMGAVTALAIIIGLITLTGAAVSLMNIMLVSVKERTREIGTIKAIGASSRQVKRQFLQEAIFIGEIGGAIGIITGIIAGNITAHFLDAPFTIPWGWMLSAMLLCIAVGILSGYIPAKRAAALDPIICLRHE